MPQLAQPRLTFQPCAFGLVWPCLACIPSPRIWSYELHLGITSLQNSCKHCHHIHHLVFDLHSRGSKLSNVQLSETASTPRHRETLEICLATPLKTTSATFLTICASTTYRLCHATPSRCRGQQSLLFNTLFLLAPRYLDLVASHEAALPTAFRATPSRLRAQGSDP
jgi:hypothetical protein